jgi:hypothetical protein
MTQGESGDKALIGGEMHRTGFGNVHVPFWTCLDYFMTCLLQIWTAFGQGLERAVGIWKIEDQ